MESKSYSADNGGLRYDEGKTQYHLIPGDGLAELARVYMFGAKKYSAYNWERGMDHSRVFNSLLRHLYAYWDGEARDPETGLHHMAHAAWNAIALLVYSLRGIGVDDRKGSLLSAQQNEAAHTGSQIGSSLGGTLPSESLKGLIERKLPEMKEVTSGSIVEIRVGVKFLTDIGIGPVWEITETLGNGRFRAKCDDGREQMMTFRAIAQVVASPSDARRPNMRCYNCPNDALPHHSICQDCLIEARHIRARHIAGSN